MLRSELVELLNKLPDVEVVVNGYEGGTDPIVEKSVELGWVDKSDGGWDYFGKYGDFESDDRCREYPGLISSGMSRVIAIQRGKA